MSCVGLSDLDCEIVKVLVGGFSDEIDEDKIVEALLTIDGDLFKVFVCWFDEIDYRKSRALISGGIDVSVHDHVAVTEVANFKNWCN